MESKFKKGELIMALMYTRKANGEDVRLGFYSDKDEYCVFIGKRLYGVAYNLEDAYKLFNEVA